MRSQNWNIRNLVIASAGGIFVILVLRYSFSSSSDSSVVSHGKAKRRVRSWFEEDLISIRGSTELKPAPLSAQGSDVVSIPSVEVSVFKDGKWQKADTCTRIDRFTYEDDFVRLPLMSPIGRIPVYIHEPAMDGISNRVYKQRRFEPRILELILLFVLSEPDVSFIDVGTNIGLHTLPVLKLDRPVMSFEAVPTNVQHLCASANDLRLFKKLKVVHNAVGSDHEPSMFVLGRNGTYGDNFVDVKGSNIRQNKMKTDIGAYSKRTVAMPTAMLDDLLSWPDNTVTQMFKKNFFKIDVEGSEAKALEGAVNFLKNTNTIGIIMEWRWHRGQPSGAKILEILTSLNFEPFNPEVRNLGTQKPSVVNFHDIFTSKLNTKLSAKWPHDVLWIPRK